MFVILLTSIVSASNHTKCMSLNNQKYMSQPTFIIIYIVMSIVKDYPFAINLDRCAESCNTLDYISSRVCVPNETEDLNLHVFNMMAGIIKSKTLAKHISCKCECIIYSKKLNFNQKWNNDKCQCECKNPKEKIFEILQDLVEKMVNM